MRLVAYLRVSTDRQAEHGLGLTVQRQAIRQWARNNGHRIVAWHSDEGVSGSNGLETRVALQEAMQALRAGAEGLVVYRLDRLARDLQVQERVLAEIWLIGKREDGTFAPPGQRRVFSTARGEDAYLTDDADDPSRKFIRQVVGAAAEYDRNMIRLRLRNGRRVKRERGGYAGDGPPPFGWQALNGSLVPEKKEQAALARIAELHASGASLRAIATTLETEGHAPRGRPKRKGEEASGKWSPQALSNIIKRLEATAKQ